jgi:hypoxanthine phosphoribosyltransferase
MIRVFDKTFEIFIPESQIAARVAMLAEQINAELKDTNPVFIVVLNGAFFFAADLLKKINFDYEVSFVKIASYDGLTQGADQKTLIGLDENLEGRHVVLIEDIMDSGKTMFEISGQLKEIPVSDLKIATLIFKPNSIRYPIAPDFAGFEVPDDFLVGYGLDYNKRGRHYRDIYKLS